MRAQAQRERPRHQKLTPTTTRISLSAILYRRSRGGPAPVSMSPPAQRDVRGAPAGSRPTEASRAASRELPAWRRAGLRSAMSPLNAQNVPADRVRGFVAWRISIKSVRCDQRLAALVLTAVVSKAVEQFTAYGTGVSAMAVVGAAIVTVLSKRISSPAAKIRVTVIDRRGVRTDARSVTGGQDVTATGARMEVDGDEVEVILEGTSAGNEGASEHVPGSNCPGAVLTMRVTTAEADTRPRAGGDPCPTSLTSL
jgi:hypothetical protein